jgi:two-component system, chemotaxis family, chemotaxis protein CheY
MNAKIMVVDDSMMVRQQVGGTLKAAGFEVVEAHDGVDALKRLAGAPETALIVLDVNMPVMNGIEFLRCLRRDARVAGVPVVMLTTEGHPQLMQEAKALGAKGWIIKPFKADLLVATVQKLTKSVAVP